MLEGLAPTNYAKTECSIITRSKTELNADDQKILMEALENPLFSNINLAQQLTERGFPIGETAMRKHRSGKCACARKSE